MWIKDLITDALAIGSIELSIVCLVKAESESRSGRGSG